jgi:RND family efflux transporter MFP subunit
METRDSSRPPQKKKSRLFVILAITVLILILFGGLTLFQRHSQYQALAEETEALSVPTVAVIHPTTENSENQLILPGNLQAYVESPIYARTNGYLKKWYRDIGSRVAKGELLADIDTPEVDAQLLQAKADLATAEANANLSNITATRYQELIKTDGVSKQEVDNAVGDLAAKKAIVSSAQANLDRLQQLESFKHIYAPFAGVITRRNVDIGTLINAGNTGASQLLFTLAQTDPIRVYVSVPEGDAPSVHPGLGAYLDLTQFPGRKFEGKVVRSADAIDPSTRTLLTEVDVPNRSGELLPGGYAQVHLEVKVASVRLQVPINALLFRSEGLRAVIIADNKAHLAPLTIGRDYGRALEVLSGLKPTDWIALNPPDSIYEGQQVKVMQSQQKSEAPASSGTAGAQR